MRKPVPSSLWQRGLPAGTAGDIRSVVFICLILAVVTMTIYWPLRNADFINYDDSEYLTENRNVKGGLTLDGVRWAFRTTIVSNWHPLTWVSHMADITFFGMHSGSHHMVNVALHILNTLLLFLILRRMTGELWKSALVAALFAVHPLHVESVAWISERKDMLSTFFWMLTLWAYISYCGKRSAKKYAIVLLFFTLGLLSKPMVVTLPCVLLLLDFWPLGRLKLFEGNIAEKMHRLISLVTEKIPFFMLSVVSSLVTYWVQKSGGAVNSWEVFPLPTRLGNAVVSYVSYLIKMIWPFRLSVFYPHHGQPPIGIVFLACLLLMVISIAAVHRLKEMPYFTVGWLWYLGTLVPVIGIIQVGSQGMADRYTYISLIGIFISLVWGVSDIVKRVNLKKVVYLSIVIAIFVILIASSRSQVRYWKDSVSLFEHAIQVTRNNDLAYHNLGLALDKNGKFREAIYQFKKALRLQPNDHITHHNLARSLDKIGETDQARAHYLEALRLKPDFAKGYANLGNSQMHQGEIDAATASFTKAIELKPNLVEAWYNMGVLMLRMGKNRKAAYYFTKAIQIDLRFSEAYNNLGVANLRMGRIREAADYFAQAIRIDPKNEAALNNIKKILRVAKNEKMHQQDHEKKRQGRALSKP